MSVHVGVPVSKNSWMMEKAGMCVKMSNLLPMEVSLLSELAVCLLFFSLCFCLQPYLSSSKHVCVIIVSIVAQSSGLPPCVEGGCFTKYLY